MKVKGVSLVMLALAVPFSAHAQTWHFLPNGELGYTTPYTTTGFFTCFGGVILSTCAASGNQVTFTAPDGGTSSLIFNGVTSTLTASNSPDVAFLGNISGASTGNGAPWPTTVPGGHSSPSFLFTLVLQGAGIFVKGYSIDQGFNCCQGLPNYITMGVATQPPPPYSYEQVIFQPVFWTEGEGDIYAQTVLVPEPGSLLLVGTGLLGVCGIGARRRVVRK